MSDTPEVMALDARKGELDARFEAASDRVSVAMRAILEHARGEQTPSEARAELKAATAALAACNREQKDLIRELKQAMQAASK